MKSLLEFKIGDVGSYIHDYFVDGLRCATVQIPASVGLGMVLGLAGSYKQLGVEPLHNGVRNYFDSRSYRPLCEDETDRLRSDHRDESIKQSLCFIVESAKFNDLENKAFVCVGNYHGHVFVYKHDWSWYIVYVSTVPA